MCSMSDIYRYGYGLSICYAILMSIKSTSFCTEIRAHSFLSLQTATGNSYSVTGL